MSQHQDIKALTYCHLAEKLLIQQQDQREAFSEEQLDEIYRCLYLALIHTRDAKLELSIRYQLIQFLNKFDASNDKLIEEQIIKAISIYRHHYLGLALEWKLVLNYYLMKFYFKLDKNEVAFSIIKESINECIK